MRTNQTTSTTRICKNCSQAHSIHYAEFKTRAKHLFYLCPKNNTRYYIKFIPDLPIDTILSRPAVRKRNEDRQGDLFTYLQTCADEHEANDLKDLKDL